MKWRSLETYHPSPSFTLISFKPVYKDLIRNVLPKHDNISLFSLKIYLFPVLKVIASSIILQNIIIHLVDSIFQVVLLMLQPSYFILHTPYIFQVFLILKPSYFYFIFHISSCSNVATTFMWKTINFAPCLSLPWL